MDFDGVYIVTENDSTQLILTKFSDFISGVKIPVSVRLMEMRDCRTTQVLFISHIGDDGKEVDLKRGSLVIFSFVKVQGRNAFHIANVGPGNEISAIQYELALSKLGWMKKWWLQRGSFAGLLLI
jgi:hypothetical protein